MLAIATCSEAKACAIFVLPGTHPWPLQGGELDAARVFRVPPLGRGLGGGAVRTKCEIQKRHEQIPLMFKQNEQPTYKETLPYGMVATRSRGSANEVHLRGLNEKQENGHKILLDWQIAYPSWLHRRDAKLLR